MNTAPAKSCYANIIYTGCMSLYANTVVCSGRYIRTDKFHVADNRTCAQAIYVIAQPWQPPLMLMKSLPSRTSMIEIFPP